MQHVKPSQPRAAKKLRTPAGRFLDYLGIQPVVDKNSAAGGASGVLRPYAAALGQDVVGGLISALISLSFSLSFAAMIFAGELTRDLGYGIRMSLTSAGITVIVVALLSPFRFAIAGPDSRSAAVQAALAAGLVAAFKGQALPTPLILFAISLSTLLTGAFLYTCGRLKMGTWIRYVPYPVIGGFLAATGWALIVGAIRVVTSRTLSIEMLPELLHPSIRLHLLVGILYTILLVWVLGRVKHFLALPGLLVLGTLGLHGVRALYGVSVAQAQAKGWLLKVAAGGHLWLPLRDTEWMHFSRTALNSSTLGHYAGGLVVLVTVTAIAVLITGAAIEVATRSDANLDDELKSHGLANLLSGLSGGLIGQNAIARSMINLQAGGKSRLSGVLAGTICLVVELTRPELAGLLARPIMGATLAFLGLRLLEEWLIKARGHLERTDYYLVVGILLLIIWFGFVAGLLVGLTISCLIFAVNYSRISVIKSSFTLDEYGSKVQRGADENEYLHAGGNRHWVLRLRGFLFFGSVVRLVQDARARIDSCYRQDRPLQTLVLDFAAAIGIDSSAAMTLVKLRQTAEKRHVQIVFTALQPEMEKLLKRENCLRNDDVCLAFPDLDRALEHCEDKMLSERTGGLMGRHSFASQLATALGSDAAAKRLLSYADRLELAPNQYLVRQGDPSDALFIIESGRLSIMLELPNGRPLRLRSVASNTSLGEIGLYREKPRSTSVLADVQTVVHRLSKQALTRMENEEPKLAVAFHTYIVRILAERLTSSDLAIAALER